MRQRFDLCLLFKTIFVYTGFIKEDDTLSHSEDNPC